MASFRSPFRKPFRNPFRGPLSAPLGGSSGGTPVTWSTTDISANLALSNGDLTVTQFQNSNNRSGVGADSSFARTTGKLYVAFKIDNRVGSWLAVGFSPVNSARNVDLGQNANTYGYSGQGTKYFDGSFGGTVYTAFTTGAEIGAVIDIDNNTVEFLNDNVSQGVESVTLDAASYVPALNLNSVNDQVTLITTGGTSTYSPPTGATWWGES